MRVKAITLGAALALLTTGLTTGCGAFTPVMAEGRVKARVAESPMFASEDSNVSVTVLSSTVKQVRKDDSGTVPRTDVPWLRRGDLPKEIRQGSVVECDVEIRRKFQSNDWGQPRATDCEIVG
ncbi:hypothetical protein GCM10009678_73370 [Actinomadura kijaniata]|uniref:Lipoprotein n=1 Tax=Actinomadura namibiensis TaxID=182080 RepID=A0A7W3QP51_ACTNM|nr:hypothetical protein [Actinomadura namibiensis]MBA8954236.1 hypothetical protein [Actinomadura namibiensis]